jgi:hypothetical protein
MALHVPPVTDETDAIAAFLGQAQDAFRVLLHGLGAREAALTPSASSLSLGGLVKHATAIQRGWLASAEAAPGLPARDDSAEGHLDGFTFRETDSLAVPVPDAPWFPQDIQAWSVRWVWWHLMEELTRHAGHGDIIRETLDGATMYPLVAARDGLPDLPFLKAWRPAAATVAP